ncbi:type III-B CRISPR module RAMP protein Cmr1 [Lujinxingia vulgaris]|uniref:Type III-B CRISPR module RAMP protein Cmr1 n=1 Tax=Lujinxingia vulgaris TaxID=2600176 RepID=A0A5C6WZ39_9DELT|nr:type III-B CRISPR module RAMP protein Cmr1 [Lujinxingia vulgaris]TXD34813.1 type III-B CRISPR module RAMP protein Cmr1 [Lujinxingia vulgaris]
MTQRTYTVKALSNLWTGTARVKKKYNKRTRRNELVDVVDSSRLITTGLLGSIRWWYEVVARGLGGKPCDPSNTKCIDRKHCVVCEFFGCTGWARKFRFDVLDFETDAEGQPQQIKDAEGQLQQIKKDKSFTLRFTPLRAVRDEEWALLDLTLRLIAEHGAIGGKTVFKPTEENERKNEVHHQDFGIIALEASYGVASANKATLEAYARDSCWRNASQSGVTWASLENFWSVSGQYLARQDVHRSTFNKVIGRSEPKSQKGNGDSWLAGRRAGRGKPGESKKVFSFREPPRTFGFVNPKGGNDAITLDTIKLRLEKAWGKGSVDDEKLLTGPEILGELLKVEET